MNEGGVNFVKTEDTLSGNCICLHNRASHWAPHIILTSIFGTANYAKCGADSLTKILLDNNDPQQ